MASKGVAALKEQENQVLVGGSSTVKVVTLNRPQKLNALNYPTILQLLKLMRELERDGNIKLVILKGNGRAFCAGGDVAAVYHCIAEGHWSFGSCLYRKELQLVHIVATYKKPLVSLINGLTMGAGAGLSTLARFRVVTENAIFGMPEAIIGHFPDVGASYFLSRLPGFFGEYIGLTGARLDGSEMLACGLATNFVLSKNLPLLEEALCKVDTEDPIATSEIISQYALQPLLKKDSAFRRLDLINGCFSKGSVEDILSSLEHENVDGKDEWITATIKSIKMGSPTNLKLFLRSIKEGQQQDIDVCLTREYAMACHNLRGTVSNDFFEGVRAMLLDKDKRPKWEPSALELVNDEMLNPYFRKTGLYEDGEWEDLQLPCRSTNLPLAKL